MKYLKNYLILENIQRAKQLLSKINIDADTSDDFKKIRQLLSGHDGYVYWFTDQFFTKKQSLVELTNVWDNIKSNTGLVSLFSKKIVDMENIEEFWDELAKVQIKQRVKSLFNEFPAAQKKLINLENDTDFNLLDLLSQNKSKDVILKKIALYKSKDQLFTAINRLVNYKLDSNFSEIYDRVNKTGSKIIYENEDELIIICKVNYSQLNTLGGDTAWCIVRSEHTFNSYNSEVLSSQFIIFLTDRNDVMSKIGLTTNLYGYRTAHSKNDGYVSLEDLRFILEDRDFAIGNLYPNKEEVTFSMFSRINTSVLIDYGFSKDDIVKHKQLFKGDDLKAFTEKEIEDNNLLDRTELSYQSLFSFSKETIIEKNLLNRVPHQLNLEQLSALKFNLKDINSLVKSNKYSLNREIDNKIYEDITKVRSKKSAIKLLSDVWKYRRGRDDDPRVYVQRVIISLLGINSDDISLNDLDRILENDFFGESSTRTWNKMKYYTDFGYDISDVYEYVMKSDYRVTFKFISNLIARTDISSIVGLEELLIGSFNKMLESNDRYQSNFDLNSEVLSEIKRNISNYPDLYQVLYDRCKKAAISNLYNLRVKDDKSYGINFEKTVRNINFFGLTGVDIPFNRITDILDSMGYDWTPTLKFFDKMGYSYSGKQGFDVISKLVKRDDEIKTLGNFIKHGIYVEDSYDLLAEYLKNRNEPLSDYDKNSLKELFAKSEKYKDLWEEHVKRDRINYIILTTLRSSKYWSNSRGGDSFEPQNWYDRFFEEFSKIDLNNCGFKDPYRIGIGAIIMLAKIGKIKDFNKVNFDFLNSKGNWTFSDGRNSLTDLCKVIANKNITNWDYTWRIYLNPKERKSIYNWLVKYIDSNQGKEGVSKYFIDVNMLVCYYLYDKDKLRKTIDTIKKKKSNISVQYYGKDKPNVSTNRLMDIKYLLGFLAEGGKWDDFRKYLSEFAELKMGKDEIKKIRTTLRWYLHHAKAVDAEDKTIHTSGQGDINNKEATRIINEIFPLVKESRILRWNEL